MDDTYFHYIVKKTRDTEALYRPVDRVPAAFIQKVKETGINKIAQYLWENRELLFQEGTRAFVQPEDLLIRSEKPSTHFHAKDQSQYPGAPDETPASKDGQFPHRTDNGQVDWEPLLHETFPFTTEQFPTPGYTGTGSDVSAKPYVSPTSAQHGMEAEPLVQDPEMIPGLIGHDGMDQQPTDDINAILGDGGGEPQSNIDGSIQHVCPICKQGFDGDDALTSHLMGEHHVTESRRFPFGKQKEIPSPIYPYER